MKMIKVMGEECLRCGHVWVPKKGTKVIRRCPKCKSCYWDVKKKSK